MNNITSPVCFKEELEDTHWHAFR